MVGAPNPPVASPQGMPRALLSPHPWVLGGGVSMCISEWVLSMGHLKNPSCSYSRTLFSGVSSTTNTAPHLPQAVLGGHPSAGVGKVGLGRCRGCRSH